MYRSGQHNSTYNLTIFRYKHFHISVWWNGVHHLLDSEKIATGIIITENERSASRHLKHCASEGNIPIMSAYWIIRSLQLGKLLPLKEKTKTCKLPTLVLPEFPDTMCLSREI